jgi:hypothetical protein
MRVIVAVASLLCSRLDSLSPAPVAGRDQQTGNRSARTRDLRAAVARLATPIALEMVPRAGTASRVDCAEARSAEETRFNCEVAFSKGPRMLYCGTLRDGRIDQEPCLPRRIPGPSHG